MEILGLPPGKQNQSRGSPR